MPGGRPATFGAVSQIIDKKTFSALTMPSAHLMEA
jgi:hypothetical protein